MLVRYRLSYLENFPASTDYWLIGSKIPVMRLHFWSPDEPDDQS